MDPAEAAPCALEAAGLVVIAVLGVEVWLARLRSSMLTEKLRYHHLLDGCEDRCRYCVEYEGLRKIYREP